MNLRENTMKNFLALTMNVAIMLLIQSCSSANSSQSLSLESETKVDSVSTSTLVHVQVGDVVPFIPFDINKAFLPLRKDKDGKINPSYQWRVCKKKFIWCLEWEPKRVYFYDLQWFLDNGYGLTKRPAL
jgi:hypothetical protein